MKILVVGDSFVSVEVFKKGFAGIERAHEIEYMQLDESHVLEPATDSERTIREFLGTPGQVAARAGDKDVLVVHGAPVTDEVLEAGARLRLVCCARGGPVNVDVKAVSARGLPLV